MQTVDKSLIQICIRLTPEEQGLEKRLNEKGNTKLFAPPDFQVDKAWELANLTRIAYKNYELFNGKPPVTTTEKEWGYKIASDVDSQSDDADDQPKQDNTRYVFRPGSTLYTSSKIDQERIDDYLIDHDSQEADSKDKVKRFYDEDYYCYRISEIYSYLAYTFKGISIPPTPVPDVDNFGFIAERIDENDEKLIYVIFRGTREPEEWFVNFQFKQLLFLQREAQYQSLQEKPQNEPDSKSKLKPKPEVSLGFNKIYTDFRPGVFQNEKPLNRLSLYVDERARKRSETKYPRIHELHKHMKDSIFNKIENYFRTLSKDTHNIYIAGHSLGGALATISALHIARILEITQINQDSGPRVFLYTFASPRVGNSAFAKECSQKLKSYRISNSADIVPSVPPGTFRVVGEEMLPGKVIFAIRKAVKHLSQGVFDDTYEHVGYPVYFTSQLNGISSNHNMSATYCHALQSIQQCKT